MAARRELSVMGLYGVIRWLCMLYVCTYQASDIYVMDSVLRLLCVLYGV